MKIKTATTEGVVEREGTRATILGHQCVIIMTGDLFHITHVKSGMTASRQHKNEFDALDEAAHNFQSHPWHEIAQKIHSSLKFVGLEYPLNP